nr:MAG TPA: hypothetical protein [Caudoviricetes sp.]
MTNYPDKVIHPLTGKEVPAEYDVETLKEILDERDEMIQELVRKVMAYRTAFLNVLFDDDTQISSSLEESVVNDLRYGNLALKDWMIEKRDSKEELE